jgi:ribosomal protein L37AE/L43A
MPLFPLTQSSYACPKCKAVTNMIQYMPVWVCPICRSAFEPPEQNAPRQADSCHSLDTLEQGV